MSHSRDHLQNKTKYSQTYIKRQPLEPLKSCRLGQVVIL